MAPAPVLHRETRVPSSPSSPSHILHIPSDPNADVTAAGRKRAFDQISGRNDDAYARQHLATEGSVCFRSKQRAPRAFLWRVLDERKILDIQSVDLVHDARDERARVASGITFRIHIPAGIVQNGIAFADPEDTDALEAFILTNANELYTITLRRDLLLRDTVPKDFDASTCLQKHSSSSLSFRHPFKLVATSHLEVLVSLHDGGILRLSRQPGESGTRWRETILSEGNWGDTIRGLISLKRHETVPFGDWELDPSTIAAMVKSPNGRLIWTVTLDHQLKAWSSATGKPVQQIDLLNQKQDMDDKKSQKYVMRADQGTLLQLVVPSLGKKHTKGEQEGPYILVVRSPKDNQFKFYRVAQPMTDGTDEQIQLHDLQPTATLIPPLDDMMDAGLWRLEDFAILPGTGWQGTQLWVRARNGKLCKTFTVSFNLLDKKSNPADDIEEVWQSGWTAVDSGMQTADALDLYTQYPRDHEYGAPETSTTPSERWLNFLFYPGRFSEASIETALSIYSKSRRVNSNSGSKSLKSMETPLQERLTQAVASEIVLKRLADDQPDYARYYGQIQAYWNTLYSLLRDLHARRNDSIGLALDLQDGLAWSVCADFSAPIRANSQFEALEANANLLDDDDKLQLIDQDITTAIFPSNEAIQACRILAASKAFTARLSAQFREDFADDVVSGSFDVDASDNQQNERRVQELYERHHFSGHVMDDDFEALELAAQAFGGLGDLSDGAFLSVLESMQQDVDVAGARTHKALNGYGDQFTIAVAQETLERNRGVLLDLLVLVVFMYGDLDHKELHSEFVAEIGPLCAAIVVRLKHVEMLSWLARNVILDSQHRRPGADSRTLETEPHVITMLQRIFIADWDPRSQPSDSVSVQLTKWTKQWTYGPDVWDSWDGLTGHIISTLIKEQALGLAEDFQKFLPQTGSPDWLRYLEGRLMLATGQYAQASLKFQAAAEGMAEAKEITIADSAHLLSAEERNYFGDGQSRFYQHVSALFETLKIFSYAADFAKLALDVLESGDDAGANSLAEIDRRKAVPDSPAHQRAAHALDEIDILKEYERRKEEIRIRLFTALVETGRFPEALEALAGISERPIRNSNLSILIKACIERDAVPTLLDLPFDAADLHQEADAALLVLAKKSLASGSSSPPYYQILYAYRTQHNDFRGAAGILYEHLQRLRHTQTKHGILDPEEETLTNAYVLLINTLACCGQDDAWLLAGPIEEIQGPGGKRRLITLADVRREYAAELDKRSDILQGRFPLLGTGEPMDVL